MNPDRKSPAIGDPANPPRSELPSGGGLDYDSLTRQALASGYFAGSVLRVERRGRPALEKAWGLSLDTPSDRRPMTSACLFDVASITKLFTTTAILRLVTLGRLGLEDRLSEVLGWSRSGLGSRTGSGLGGRLGKADIRAALSHSTGLHYWFPFYTRRNEGFETILESVVERHPPKDEVIYSDLNFMLMGKVIETASGQPLGNAMAELVFKPLGLIRSSYGRPVGRNGDAPRAEDGFQPGKPVLAGDVAAGDAVAATEWGNRIEMGMVKDLGLVFDGWRDTAVPIVGFPDDGNCHYYFGGQAGHAGIFSDARDLCTLGRLYLDGGRIGSHLGRSGETPGGQCAPDVGGSVETYLDPLLAEEACSDHGGGRGLGFQLGENYPGSGLGHGGFTGTYLYLNREAGMVAAILTNRLHVSCPRKVTDYMQRMIQTAIGGAD